MTDRPTDSALSLERLSNRLQLLYSADIIFTSRERTESDVKHPVSGSHRMSWRQ